MKVELQEWWVHNIPDDNLIYKNGVSDQCLFVRDVLMRLFENMVLSGKDRYGEQYFYKRGELLNVIGTHRSKSIKLPVIEIDLSKIGIKIILRYNFYDWCISIESEKDIDCDFMELPLNDKGYFEGFPKDRIYECYSDSNKKKFSIVLGNKYKVFTFMFLLRNHVIKELNKKVS